MARLTLTTQTGDLIAVEARLTLPLAGLWHAELWVETSDLADLQGLATLSIEADDKTRVWVGQLFQASVFGGRGRVRLLPTAGLIQPVPPKYYQKAPARIVATDVLLAVGEVLDPLSSLDVVLPHWTRRGALGRDVLSDLAEAVGLHWRAQDDGQVLVGELPAVPFTGEYQILEDKSFRQEWELDVAGVDLSPGMTLEDRPIDRVSYLFSGASQACTVRLG